MIASITTIDPATGVRRTVSAPQAGTHEHLAVLRRYVRTEPILDDDGRQIGWRTKPADWYLAWAYRSRRCTTYRIGGLEAERGFRTKKEALARKREILKGRGSGRGRRATSEKERSYP